MFRLLGHPLFGLPSVPPRDTAALIRRTRSALVLRMRRLTKPTSSPRRNRNPKPTSRGVNTILSPAFPNPLDVEVLRFAEPQRLTQPNYYRDSDPLRGIENRDEFLNKSAPSRSANRNLVASARKPVRSDATVDHRADSTSRSALSIPLIANSTAAIDT